MVISKENIDVEVCGKIVPFAANVQEQIMWQHMPAFTLRVSGTSVVSLSLMSYVTAWQWLSWNIVSVVLMFAVTQTLVLISLTVILNWSRAIPHYTPIPHGAEIPLGVVVVTAGEPVSFLENTLRSVLECWPHHLLRIVVGDDAIHFNKPHAKKVRELVEKLAEEFPQVRMHYYNAPHKSDPRRKGDAKAGNQNACVAFLTSLYHEVEYLDLRDMDDRVGDREFFYHALGFLKAHSHVGYVQSTKVCQVSKGDPFANNEEVFYRVLQQAKNLVGWVLACGSGLVVRVEMLKSIGGLPARGPVEDLELSLWATGNGWRGVYLPLIGADGQIAPEDTPNHFKQRGTWALDTVRLLVYGFTFQIKLTIWQKLAWFELLLSYTHSLSLVVYLITPVVVSLLNIEIFRPGAPTFLFVLMAAAVEGWLVIFAKGYYREMWVSRIATVALIPAYLRGMWLGLTYYSEPVPYKVTRKSKEAGWYLRETMGMYVLFGLLVLASVKSVLGNGDSVTTIFSVYASVLVGAALRLTWFGYGFSREKKGLLWVLPLAVAAFAVGFLL